MRLASRGAARLATRAATVLALCALAACAAAPIAGPTGAAVREANAPDASTLVPFAYVPITSQTLDALDRSRAEPPADLNQSRGGDAYVMRVGDVVTVTIWEAVEGGLFSGESSSSRAVTLPTQRVGPDGTISVPYAGRVKAAGRTPDSMSKAVVSALEGKAIEPQVIVTVNDSPVSAVTVVGDAAAEPSRMPLKGVGERVLDAVAASGGTKVPSHRTLVRLTRGSEQLEAHLARILREPAQNVRLRSGDVLALLDLDQSFTVMGAAARPQRIAFDSEVVTLEQALAEAGGLNDNKADASSVFVFRYEDRGTAEAVAGPEAVAAAEAKSASPAFNAAFDQTPVVYNLNLMDPSSFFLARRFQVNDGDIIYAANAEMTQVQKVLDLVSTVLAPATNSLRFANSFD